MERSAIPRWKPRSLLFGCAFFYSTAWPDDTRPHKHGKKGTVAQVAEALLVDEKTVRILHEKHVCGGEDELLTLFYVGKEPLLTIAQQKKFADHLDENTYLDSKAVAHDIEKTYGVRYSRTGVKELPHRLDFVYKKPKHAPGKLDPAKQEAFLSEYAKLRKTKGKNDPIDFADAVHPQFNSIPAYGWIRRGTDKELKSNAGRKQVNINGAVDIDTLEAVTDFTKSVNKESSLRLFKKIESKHPKAKAIHIYLDNAGYSIAKWLKEALKGTKIVLHYLPGYSPNLNLIEWLWKFFKKKQLYNKHYEKFEDFLLACKGFFRCRKKHHAELRTPLIENFYRYQK